MRKHSRFLTALLGIAMSGVLSAAAMADGTFKIDPVHSSIEFKIKHANVSYVYGRFNDVAGTFTLEGDKSAVEATVPVKSVDTKNGKRDDHLRGPDFFNAKQFEDISFKTTKATAKDDKIEVTGDLTLHGVTKSITLTLTKVGEGPGMGPGEVRAGVEGSFTLKRSDYGMDKMVPMVGDEVTLMISLEGVKQ